MAQMIGGSYVAQLMEPESRPDPDRPVAFVAVDLLAVDGSRLLDVPLLERKRLLESSIKRASWFGSPRSSGLPSAATSRPGAAPDSTAGIQGRQ